MNAPLTSTLAAALDAATQATHDADPQETAEWLEALDDVFGDRAVIQRCQVHKQRNLREHLPEERHGYVLTSMREAYRATTASTTLCPSC